MKITDDHWLEGVERQPLKSAGVSMPIRRCAVIHATAGATGQSSINFWRTPAAKGAGAHLVIERDGKIIQCRQFNRTCGHAGVSRWIDPNTGNKFVGLNSCSIGIELANALDSDDALKWARRQPGFQSIKAKHRNGGSVVEWERYYTPQLNALEDTCRALVDRYNLDDLTGHDCIAPERKVDPGPAFDIVALRWELGFKENPPPVHRK